MIEHLSSTVEATIRSLQLQIFVPDNFARLPNNSSVFAARKRAIYSDTLTFAATQIGNDFATTIKKKNGKKTPTFSLSISTACPFLKQLFAAANEQV